MIYNESIIINFLNNEFIFDDRGFLKHIYKILGYLIGFISDK